MKLKLLLVIMLFPLIAMAQRPDTLGLVMRVDSVLRVVNTLNREGAFDKAIDLCDAASHLVLEKVGREHSTYGKVCSAYGNIFYNQGNLTKAEEWLLLALDIKGKSLGKGHLSYAKDLTLLGVLYRRINNYTASELMLVESKNVYQANLGKSHPLYAGAAVNLANLYFDLGEGEKTESLLLEAKDLFESGQIEKRHQYYASCLNNLANLYTDYGIYQKAENLLRQSADIVKNELGEDNPMYAQALSNLAIVEIYMERNDAAESLLLQAKGIIEKAEKTESLVYAEIVLHLGQVYRRLGQWGKAEPLVEESLRIDEKMSGRKHYRTGLVLHELAKVNWKKGNTQKAEPLYQEASVILKSTLGKEHPFFTGSAHEAAAFYRDIHQYSVAMPLVEEACEGEKAQIVKSAQHLSERELSERIKSFAEKQNMVFSFAQSQSALSELSYDNALFYKGFLLNAVQQLQGVAARNPASIEKLSELKSLQRQLAKQYAATLAERDSADVAKLEAEANALEKELAREVTGYSEAIRQLRWQDVQAALKHNEIAIEFLDYQYYDSEATDSVMYAALVLRAGDTPPQFVPLFEKKELLPLLRGATGGNNFLKINALYASKPFAAGQKSPYELIWKPLEKYLSPPAGEQGGAIYCSSSGLLHYLNLAAIPMPDGKPFGDTRHLVLLGSTRSLAVDSKAGSLAIPNTANYSRTADAYLAGGIRYESESNAVAYAQRDVGKRSTETSNVPAFQPDSSITRAGDLNYLPATATEVHEIGQMLRAANFSAKVDTGFFASEEAFRSLGIGKPSPRILHLATHGYFFPDTKGKKTNAGQETVFKMSEHPMIRSGLIMAGAKQAWLTGKHPEGQEDGILTAYEISQMNLSNTELVVLSACETGLGQISGNEGVYGLQRAFKIAGVKYLIMSLWKVDDRSTKAFMAEFYKQWLQGKQPIPQAFRAAQQAMRAKSPSPYDWAGFVLIE